MRFASAAASRSKSNRDALRSADASSLLAETCALKASFELRRPCGVPIEAERLSGVRLRLARRGGGAGPGPPLWTQATRSLPLSRRTYSRATPRTWSESHGDLADLDEFPGDTNRGSPSNTATPSCWSTSTLNAARALLPAGGWAAAARLTDAPAGLSPSIATMSGLSPMGCLEVNVSTYNLLTACNSCRRRSSSCSSHGVYSPRRNRRAKSAASSGAALRNKSSLIQNTDATSLMHPLLAAYKSARPSSNQRGGSEATEATGAGRSRSFVACKSARSCSGIDRAERSL
mmetsp:Transcript_3508/g.10241  ORF Transcript_3508/g.10241 Transcript_3508/m.10241 type:complete len:289 (-) Transcript_3508:214-1080(-)